MKIHIPNSVWLGNIDPFLQGFDPSNPTHFSLSFHPRWTSVHPMVLSMIASLGMRIDPKEIECKIPTAKSRHYFERMGLFNFLKTDSGINITSHDPTGRFIPLTQIRTSGELTKFINEMTPLLHLSPKEAEPIRYILSELIRNVLEHAQTKEGAIVCAQYYKESNVVRVGIADAGIGIRQSMQHYHHPKDDSEAIRLALMPGVTGTTKKEGGTEQNAGAGLFFIKSMAYVNDDFFVIYTGTALYKLKKRLSKKIKLEPDPWIDRHSKKNDLPKWQGTIVGVDLSLDQTQEFSFLLKQFRETFKTAIKDRKKARYTKPKFI